VKIQPRLILSSLCVLLCQGEILPAQESPQPRFGYGSVPRGAYVIPAPKTGPRAVVAKNKPKTAATPPSKPKPKAASTAKPAVKDTPTVAKAKPKSALDTPPAKASKEKEMASAKSKVKPKAKATGPATKSTKTEIAKNPPKASIRQSSAKPRQETAAVRPSKLTLPEKPASRDNAGVDRALVKANPVQKSKIPPTPAASLPASQELVAETKRPQPATGFHFFGAPIQLPAVPAPLPALEKSPSPSLTAKAPQPVKSNPEPHVVDLIAARHSLSNNKSKPEPASARVTSMAAPAPTPIPDPPPATLAITRPEKSAFLLDGPAQAPVTLDEPDAARSVPASLSLAASAPFLPGSSSHEPAPETTLLDEPALPEPVRSSPPVIAHTSPPASKGKPAPPTPDTVTESPLELEMTPVAPLAESEPALPTRPVSKSTASTPPPAPTENADGDLSERERAFVRSLAEAAGNVTTASGQLNSDLPRTIATAATTALDQLPAGTVATFHSLAETAKSHAKSVVPDIIPGQPMEISNDLMPASPDKMPDHMPAFEAPATGKIDVTSDRQADYDQVNNKVIFTGKVELNSATIRLRAERVEVFMKPGGGGMERVEASTNVLMRTQDTANGPGQMASAGHASYNLATGEITLSDWPKIQETGKSHISTDPSTKMVMFTDGRLRTDGPNRTILGGN